MMAAITTGTGLGMSGRGRWARGRGGVFGPVLLWGWVKCGGCGAGGAWLTGGWAGCWWAVLVYPVAGAVPPGGGPGGVYGPVAPEAGGPGWAGAGGPEWAGGGGVCWGRVGGGGGGRVGCGGRGGGGSRGGGRGVGGGGWCTRWPVRFRGWVGRGVCTGRWPRRPVARSGRGPVARSGRAGRGRRSGGGGGGRAGPEGACRTGGARHRWGVERRGWNAPWGGRAWGCRKFPPPTVTPGVPWGRVVRGRVRFHVRGPAAAGLGRGRGAVRRPGRAARR